MLTNRLTGKKMTPSQPKSRLSSPQFLRFRLKSANPDCGILQQNPLSREFASPVNFRALKYTHRRYSVCTDCLHVNTLRNQRAGHKHRFFCILSKHRWSEGWPRGNDPNPNETHDGHAERQFQRFHTTK